MSFTASDIESKLNSEWQQELVGRSEQRMGLQISHVKTEGESSLEWETKEGDLTQALERLAGSDHKGVGWYPEGDEKALRGSKSTPPALLLMIRPTL